MIDILYISCLCSSSVLEYIFKTASNKPAVCVQKFHKLLAEGFGGLEEHCIIQTLSAIPVTSASHNRRLWRIPSQQEAGVIYNYITTINFPVFKNIVVFISAFCKSVFWALKGGRKNKIAVCDILNVSISAAAMLACKLTGVKVAAIVTDLPNLMVGGFRQDGLKRRLYNKLTSILMQNYDGYIFLTEQMNQVVNIRRKPYIIMEGLVDVNMAAADNCLENKLPEKILIYAGALFEKYGVKKLIDAFMRVDDPAARLHIYGSGEMAKDMPDYIKKDNRIAYFGMVENQIVVQKQLEATLLVNPRPSDEEFTKYSFPSKNLEYMVSGTPILTTQLPGMPMEYNTFVYRFDDESVDGMACTLKTLLSRPKEELHEFGQRAKQFVLTHKANSMQAKRVLSLFIDMCT